MTNTKGDSRKPNGCLRLLLICFGIFVLIFLFESIIPSNARRNLPSSATEILEYRLGGGIFSFDTHHVLKARIPKEDFAPYAQRLGFTKYEPGIHGSDKAKFNGTIGGVPDWWNEPSDLVDGYFSYVPGSTVFGRIKWHDGWVYYSFIDW